MKVVAWKEREGEGRKRWKMVVSSGLREKNGWEELMVEGIDNGRSWE
jgi:hypothetical protein